MPKVTKKQQQKEENLKSNKKEINDITEKEKRITTEISLAEFIVPKRKRIKNENSKITTSASKRKKKRNNSKRISNLTSPESEDDKETNKKLKHKRSNTESRSNQSQETVPANTTGAAWSRMEPHGAAWSCMEQPCKIQILQEPYGDPFN